MAVALAVAEGALVAVCREHTRSALGYSCLKCRVGGREAGSKHARAHTKRRGQTHWSPISPQLRLADALLLRCAVLCVASLSSLVSLLLLGCSADLLFVSVSLCWCLALCCSVAAPLCRAQRSQQRNVNATERERNEERRIDQAASDRYTNDTYTHTNTTRAHARKAEAQSASP